MTAGRYTCREFSRLQQQWSYLGAGPHTPTRNRQKSPELILIAARHRVLCAAGYRGPGDHRFGATSGRYTTGPHVRLLGWFNVLLGDWHRQNQRTGALPNTEPTNLRPAPPRPNTRMTPPRVRCIRQSARPPNPADTPHTIGSKVPQGPCVVPQRVLRAPRPDISGWQDPLQSLPWNKLIGYPDC